MGKSSKKVKSDRINALKKQYDAFLEEDKKRKERNEYILGKLDHMRYSTAVLPLRRKASIIPDRNTLYQLGQKQEQPVLRDYHLCTNPTQIVPDIPVPKVDESLLIKEISKKYILIPKLSSAFTNNYIRDATLGLNIEPAMVTNVTKETNNGYGDNADWKSKYEILNILKKEEKGEEVVEEPTKFTHHNTIPFNKSEKQVALNDNVEIFNEPAVATDKGRPIGQKYINELPEKDLSGKSSYDLSPECNKYENDATHSVDPNAMLAKDDQTGKDHVTASDVTLNDPITANDYKLQHKIVDYKNAEDPNRTQPEYAGYEQNSQVQPAYDTNMALDNVDQQSFGITNATSKTSNVYHAEAASINYTDHEHTVTGKDTSSVENVIVLDDDISQVQVLNPNDFEEVVNKVPPSQEPGVNSDDAQYPVEVINVQEFTPNEDVKLKDGVNVNPEGHMMQQISFDASNQDVPLLATDSEYQQNPDEVTGIEEFEAEQQNMFYSEQTDPNYGYQESAGDPYNTEYAQNENYQQNEEYAYYQGTNPEAYQPVDINEHEETTQQYDPNYQQQYEGTYEPGYEEQVFQQNEQQYQENEAYPTQPEVEQMHYQQQNQETPAQVRQALDDEQGYSEMENIVQAHDEEQAVAKKAAEEQAAAAEKAAREKQAAVDNAGAEKAAIVEKSAAEAAGAP